MMKSCLYRGYVTHARSWPKRHAFRYRVFSLLLDLDELNEINSQNRVLGINRRAVLSFYESDHGDGEPYRLRRWVLRHLAIAGYEISDVGIEVLCYPRIFGYAFNPLTVYYCYDSGGSLMATLHEVHNTFGEKHTYVLPAREDGDGKARQVCDKEMYVSPFTEMEGRYDFKLNRPGDRLSLSINLTKGEQHILSAGFQGERRALTDRALLATFFQYPLMTLKVIASIHLEALRLWVKGVKLVPHAPAPVKIAVSHQTVKAFDMHRGGIR